MRLELIMYHVVYDVVGYGDQKAGPWAAREAEEQLRDIQCYECVINARLVPVTVQPEEDDHGKQQCVADQPHHCAGVPGGFGDA